ncbi:MAG: hypothetical protein N2654_00865 [Deltaproteobacteria bacterium]|nr:hypothetical protein [Deltaproteobacteria bacterium]
MIVRPKGLKGLDVEDNEVPVGISEVMVPAEAVAVTGPTVVVDVVPLCVATVALEEKRLKSFVF